MLCFEKNNRHSLGKETTMKIIVEQNEKKI